MAEERVEPREAGMGQKLPWLLIFQGFRVALDFNKLVLAAAGIIVMAFGWWLLAVIFDVKEPEWGDQKRWDARSAHVDKDLRESAKWKDFVTEHNKWKLIHQAAGDPTDNKTISAVDFARDAGEYNALRWALSGTKEESELKQVAERMKDPDFRGKLEALKHPARRPVGKLRVWPWSEDRGTNPYLLATGQAAGWKKGGFFDWLREDQVPVLLEPLMKMIRPIIYFFDPNAGPLACFYFLLVLFWTLVTWAIFGGAITRIAAVQLARKEKITLSESVRFTCKRWLSFVTAPLFPLLFVGFLMLFMMLFGLLHMIPVFGDIVMDGILWWVMLIFGVLMAVAFIGLIGWPLMSATISTEGTDSWEAVSRSYSYVFQAPWYYLWCSVVSLLYGAVVVFFVGFIGSFSVFLSKWGVSQTPFVKSANREPSYLFVYTPQSFGWRDLMLKGVVLDDGSHVVDPATGKVDPVAYQKYLGNYTSKEGETYGENGRDTLRWYNKAGAFLVAIWIYFFFLLILGFGYSFFWTSATIVYLLMRKRVDDAEIDEVYLEEDDEAYSGPLTAPTATAPPAPAAPPAQQSRPLTMVDPPVLKTQLAPPAAMPQPEPPPAATPAPVPPPPEPPPAPPSNP